MEDFKTFLKKHSFINNNFIDDFYNIISDDYIDKFNEFLIDSEILRKWLQIKIKREFNDTIKRSYKKDIDYKIEKIKKTLGSGSGGHNLEIITLTPEAAKKLCQSTKSVIGKDVRQYFIEIERVLYKYKNYIIEGLQTKNKQLENNQKTKINTSKKMIYVFRALNTDLTLYRIGKTINSKSRFKSHNSPLANDLEVVFEYETKNTDQVEACIKIAMKQVQYRKYKEIYQVDLQIIKELIKSCDALIIEPKNNILEGGYISKKIPKDEIL